jgi:hypothetical protein
MGLPPVHAVISGGQNIELATGILVTSGGHSSVPATSTLLAVAGGQWRAQPSSKPATDSHFAPATGSVFCGSDVHGHLHRHFIVQLFITNMFLCLSTDMKSIYVCLIIRIERGYAHTL